MDKKLMNWYLSGGVPQTAQVTAWLSRLTTLGYTHPSEAVITALNNFSIAIAGITNLDYLYIMSLNNVALTDTYKVNLITPASYQLTATATVDVGVAGVKGDGVTGFLDTNFNASTAGGNYQLNSAFRGVWIYEQDASGTTHIDGVTNLGVNQMMAGNVTNQRINCGSSNVLNAAADLSGTGYRAINRSSSTDVQLYAGTTKSDRTQTSTSLTNSNQFIFKNGTTFSSPRVSMYVGGG